MELNLNEQNTFVNSNMISGICSVCHQPVFSKYYFCPNCGNKLNTSPLSKTIQTQIWIYALSIILPMFCFLFIRKWPGMKYIKSEDPEIKQIGYIAWALLIISTVITIYLAFVWTQNIIQSSVDSINTDLGAF